MATNFKKLEEAYEHLGWFKKETYTPEKTETLINYVRRLIYEHMIDHQTKPKDKFDLWEYVANDDWRPALNGIYHDPTTKMAVATNAHILVADSSLFEEDKVDNTVDEQYGKNKKPVDKYGKFIEGRYPNWENCFPKNLEEYEKFTINIEDISTLLQKHKAWLKINGYKTSKYSPTCLYLIKNTYFEINYLFKFLKATKGEIQIGKSDKAGIYLSDTRKAIIMPVIVSPSNLTNIDGMLLTNVY